MGVTEETGKVASDAIDALKTSPALLVLVLLQIATIGMILYVASANAEHRQQREMLMLQRCIKDGDKTAFKEMLQ